MTAPKVSLEKVTASVTLPLPSGADLKVSKDQKVKEGQLIAERKASFQTKSYHLHKLISVSPKKAMKCLVKKLGEEIKQGELIAQKQGLLGKGEKFMAPLDGILDSLTEDGVLRIKKEVVEEKLKAPFDSRVSALSPDSVGLSFVALEIKGAWGKGGKATGYLMVIDDEDYDLFSLDTSCRQQIMALQGKLPKGLWYKGTSLGLAGFIVGGFVEKSLIKEIEEDDDILPIVILGENDKINEEIWKELKDTNGKMILIDGQQKRVLIPK
ncbi:hypothetical protein A2Z41_02995 [Microgenomates group bacterium RBG_19FT_COMBO_39_10]|nr:MAG: hypothetical protein A2Z41_02995 [Microgenomates group bacterium RBG_19FT_COMBO_39_10]